MGDGSGAACNLVGVIFAIDPADACMDKKFEMLADPRNIEDL
jgi:hypothetical protein